MASLYKDIKEKDLNICLKTSDTISIILNDDLNINYDLNDVADVADIVDSIAKASFEQRKAIDQINQGVQQVSQVVQTNSATSQQAASASQQLSAQADRMRDIVSHFRLAKAVVHFRALTNSAMGLSQRP